MPQPRDAQMLERFETLEGKVDALDNKVDSLDRKLDVQMEDLRDLVKKSAEGYGATLEAINRNLEKILGEQRAQHGDVLRVVADHEERISALEKPRRRPSR